MSWFHAIYFLTEQRYICHIIFIHLFLLIPFLLNSEFHLVKIEQTGSIWTSPSYLFNFVFHAQNAMWWSCYDQYIHHQGKELHFREGNYLYSIIRYCKTYGVVLAVSKRTLLPTKPMYRIRSYYAYGFYGVQPHSDSHVGGKLTACSCQGTSTLCHCRRQMYFWGALQLMYSSKLIFRFQNY